MVIAVVALAFTLLVLSHHGTARALDPLAVILAALACLPLIEHRRAPLGAFVVCAAASAAIDAFGYQAGPPSGPTFALLFLAADPRTRERVAQTAGVVIAMLVLHLAAAMLSSPGFDWTPILGAVALWGGAWIVGDQVRQRRQRLAELRERARRNERETARERRLAAAEERTRIARDLHDSAAHAINVILVQAGAARLLQDRDSAAVRTALNTIEDVARETIGDIDQLIRGLREDDTGVQPPTGLAAVQTLAERHRAAGLMTEVSVDGSARPLPPGLDQAAYRIVQEALTNAARYGRGSALVRIAFGSDALALMVSNPVAADSAPAPHGGGHGILGMHERAGLLGGTLQAGSAGGQFTVRAVLPYATTGRR